MKPMERAGAAREPSGVRAASQRWDARQYREHASFVAALGAPVLALLDPQPGESILDLGCGDGELTEAIAMAGCEVVGVDSSESMVEAARGRGLNAQVMSGDALSFDETFDAVFTNAALHWITDYRRVIEGVARALKPNGRFVGEFGGHGNIATLVAAMETAVTQNAEMGAFRNPWCFPTDREYARYLEDGGFAVRSIELLPRPTPLPAGVRPWLEVFAKHAIVDLPERSEEAFLSEVERLVEPALFSPGAGWHADYVRLRFHAVKR